MCSPLVDPKPQLVAPSALWACGRCCTKKFPWEFLHLADTCTHTQICRCCSTRLDSRTFFADAVIWPCDSFISWLGVSIRAAAISGLRKNHPVSKRIIYIKVANWHLNTLIYPLTIAFCVREYCVGELMTLPSFPFELSAMGRKPCCNKRAGLCKLLAKLYWILEINFKSQLNCSPSTAKLKIISDSKLHVKKANWLVLGNRTTAFMLLSVMAPDRLLWNNNTSLGGRIPYSWCRIFCIWL